MKNILKKILSAVIFFSAINTEFVFAQVKTIPQKFYKYQTAKNDRLNARIYTLSNGLKVYMTVYKDAPRIQTMIAVRAGSKNDPSDATGLAHYLEHLLFKGTDKYGSMDYAKEKPELDKIEALYETYKKTSDTLERKKIYHRIDSISGVAATFSIANEFDKMCSIIGASGTNAFTSNEETVYVNEIPSNQLDNWLTIEAERYRNPVLRLFHTELEAVYEEKNRSIDNDGSKVFEVLFSGLFQKHTYGTQTTIGTIDHLKNPSIKKIKEYYNTYYVPNNMAIILSGDFNPDSTIGMIDKKFSSWGKKTVPTFVPAKEDAITKPIVKDVYGPDAENMLLAFRFAGAGSRDADMLTLINYIFSNGTAGLIDLNLNQQQKVLGAGSISYVLKDYSTHIFYANAKQGQTLEETKNLVLSQIELVKKGEFADWLLVAIINNMKLEETKNYENNRNRAGAMLDAFILAQEWQKYVDGIDRLSKITKQEVMEFAKKNYGNNYVVVYKHTGEDKNVKKVVKPAITPVELNRNEESDFVKNIVASNPKEIEPVFIDYKKDIRNFIVKNGIQVYYNQNIENKTFDLYYVFDMGNNNDRKYAIAVDYLQYLGTSTYTPAQLQQEFYKLGCSFGVNSSNEQVYVSLSGLTENFEKGIQLFEHLLANAQPNAEALENLVSDILKERADAKLSKSTILNRAMYNYAVYGAKNPFTNILSETELKALKPGELVSLIKELNSFEHHILYYGSMNSAELAISLNVNHNTPNKLKPVRPPVKFEELPITTNTVLAVNYDMKQAEIIMLSKGGTYDKSLAPSISIFNEYFGGSMAGIVFQDLRESKALAYSCRSAYNTPSKKEKSYYNMSYIGAQADKMPEAMAGMSNLLNNMPAVELTFSNAKQSLIQELRTERITKSDILFNYEHARKMGLDYDLRADVYTKAQTMTMADVKTFQENYLKNKPSTILVVGNKNVLDVKTLEKYGTVKWLTLEEVFGY